MLKKFILNEIRKVSGNLEEVAPSGSTTSSSPTSVDLSQWLQDKSKSEIRDVERQLIDLIAKNFSGSFAKYLLRNLNKVSK